MKLGISKNELLSDVRIAKLYDEYKKKQSGSGRMQGKGIWEGFVKFLKDTKLLSNVGGVLLPAAGGALGGTIGTALGGPAGTAFGATTGTVAGKSAADWIKSQGFGRRKIMMRGGDSRLVINPPGTRLGQKGKGKMRGGAMTLSTNGTFQQVPGTPAGYGYTTQMGRGITSFNTVSSQFGNIKA